MKVLLSAIGLAVGAAAAALAPTAHAQPLPFDPVPDPNQSEMWAQDASALHGYPGGASGQSTPYSAWLSASAAQSQTAAAQARQSASAFESAFAATTNPTAIAANRNAVTALSATNIFGLNSPAIFDPVPDRTADRDRGPNPGGGDARDSSSGGAQVDRGGSTESP